MKKYLFACILSSVLLAQCSKKDSAVSTSNLNNKSVGASANDFLSASNYNTINIQLQYMPGYAPNAAALTNLVAFLNTLCNKPGGINITQAQIPASGKSVLALADISALETANRSQFNSGSVLSVYIVYLDAPYTTANVLGVSYRNTSLAVFGPTMTANSGGLNQVSRAKLESTVEEHEFGHLLGLVNLGSPMVTPHEDAAHAAHCNNVSCLMYYQTNTTSMGGVIINSPIPSLDANCRADLTANGGK